MFVPKLWAKFLLREPRPSSTDPVYVRPDISFDKDMLTKASLILLMYVSEEGNVLSRTEASHPLERKLMIQ